ncbi:MAG: serine/threonine protein kinase [Actinomycetales bacterium]|nr:serine/threonine protein kinase [Actinomycetales bacterium]
MGEVFAGRYELIDLIGEGGMGTVWLALDRKTGQHVAAKVLRQSDAGTLLRFVREQSVRIHDPHVVAPLGWAGEDDRVLFTMPVIRGGSVATLVGDYGALPPLLVAELLRQILAGLAAVHAAGIIHRDIKPANILLDATGTARPHAYVSDFGIAVDQRAPRWTEPGPISGTPGYLAPELESRGDLSPAIDLYAVGQVALTMVSGLRPGDRLYPARPADCPDSLWRVVQSLTAVDPGDRPGSALDALDLLADPELAWTASAMGDVEVFEHVSLEPTVPTRVHAAVGEEPPAPLPPALVSPSAPTSNPVPSPAPAAPPPPGPPTASSPAPAAPGPPAAPGASATPPHSSHRPWVGRAVALAIGALALVGILLIWSPWTGGTPPQPPTSPPPTASTPSTPSTTPSASSSGSVRPTTTPSPSVSPSSTPLGTTGSVTIRRVVLSVGQPCEFVDVGQIETTVDGTTVSCERQPAGGYAWVVP